VSPAARRCVRFIGLILTIGLLRPAGLAGQTGSITATATVTVFALSINGTGNLNFGNVPQGTLLTIDPRTSVNAGRFHLGGFLFLQFRLTFTLPTELQRFPGPVTMPISFGPNSGCARPTNVQATCAYFNPANPFIARFPFAFPANYYVWLGGTVNPAVNQPGGVYQGTITATVAYTGN
jgi:hypothetical protein